MAAPYLLVLKSVGAPGNYFSYAIAAYSAGALVASPVWGKCFDRFGAAKSVSLLGCALIFTGSLLYTIQSKFTILLGRFVAGLGIGLEGAVIGMIVRGSQFFSWIRRQKKSD